MTPAAAPPRKLVVIDGVNAIYRAFFGVPALRSPDGQPTNAVYGFANMLIKVLRDEAPDLVAVAFDPRGGTFRHRILDTYKAGREAQPEDLTAQLPVVRELIDAFRIPLVEVPDFEADDVIATLAREVGDEVLVTIVSTDKDLMQLVSSRVTLLDGMKDRRYDPEAVEARFGVPPEKMLDWRALVGDTSDNIPGVKGIGEKGAAKLINEWGSLDAVLEHREEVTAKRARTALEEHETEARLSRELSELRDDVALDFDLAELALEEPDRPRLRELYKRLGFSRLVETLDGEAGGAEQASRSESADSPDWALEIADSDETLAASVEALAGSDPLYLLGVLEPGSALGASLVGLALASDATRIVFVPVASSGGEGLLPLEGNGAAGVSLEGVIGALESLLGPAGRERAWISSGAKRLQSVLGELGLELPAARFDVEIASFLLDSSAQHQVWTLALRYLGRDVPSWEDVAGRGAKAIAAGALSRDGLAQWAGQQLCAIAELHPLLADGLERDHLVPLFEDVEMPLTAVLSRIERNGVRIDEARLAELSQQYESDLARIEKEAYELAGEEFLLSSPKQLQVILFEKLNLPPLKKTKTGYSTAEDVLEQLAQHHALPEKILAWRRLSKLKSTYIDALPPLVNERSGRIHPTFHQTGAATGRLSASDPNVQNIPIRTEEGVRIREAFVAAEGCRLLSADYSQVELRVMAHYSGDESLLDAFAKGEDIHRRTAAEVAGIAPEDVTADQRARAKAVNFGIIYGSSAFGLANQLGIATGEAQTTIDTYFARYSGVAGFLERTIAEAKQQGFVTTLMDRRRYLPDLSSRNRVLRQAAERMAVNTVIQGTAADLIKKAMVDVQVALEDAGLESKMILQVHDELVFEAPAAEVEALADLARGRMEAVFELRVPLVVDIGVGDNWREAH